MKSGQQTSIILHLEPQGQSQKTFATRMLKYSIAISDQYKEAVLSIAFLIDSNKNWRPDRYEKINPLTKTPYHQFFFHTVKLLDYVSKLEELDPEKNIFALVLRAQLKVIETQWTKKDPKKKEKQKKRLDDKIAFAIELRSLCRKKKVSRKNMILLQKFLDCVIKLPEDLIMDYNKQFVTKIAEDWEKNYVTTTQKVAMNEGLEKGLEKGIQKGEATLVSKLLKCRFPRAVTAKYLKMVNGADSNTLSLWAEKILNAKSIDDVFSGGKPLHS